MPVRISFVERLADVIGPAVEFLSHAEDLFARPRIVVPTAGAKAWLQDRLARRLGTSGEAGEDGVVANVDILFPGAITGLLQPQRDAGPPDPWSLDRLTFAVLDVITSPDADAVGIPYDVAREPLLAARRIASLFDSYHVRRPGMILEWERSEKNAVLAPTANDEQMDTEPVPARLRDRDLWQFDLWRRVRQRIGTPSPPARASVEHLPSRDRLLVAGAQSLSLAQLECLEKIGAVCDVEAIFVHPSPGLRASWGATGQQPLRANLRDRPLQKSKTPDLPPGVDPLLPVWLSGARDLQELLAARGVPVGQPPARDGREHREASLLARLQRTIAAGGEATASAHDPATDRSVVIHRCHSLSRQAEVLHDALLQAFAEMDDLHPHDVAIVSPCIEKAAPHLEAAFDRSMPGRDRHGVERRIRLPLVVADRGVRETSPAADLLAALLAVPGSRASIDDVLAVAGHPLVRTAFRVDDDDVATWNDFLERTVVRWGLDPDHRARHGLEITESPDVHTWKLGLERMVLGAMMADDDAQAGFAGVVPLADLDPADLVPIATLVRILDVIRTLAAATTGGLCTAAWCDAIEQALVGLCGEECPELAEPLVYLRRLREAAAGTAAESKPVPFEDVRRLLVTWLDEASGRQPLRTGAITATSMVPLRGVPFRVVCVIGYDDGAVGTAEADGDDLVTRQQLVGDVDPRADERRALLDCVLSAGERLVITCNGRNVKNNKRLSLVTPLAEFVDFAVRHGAGRDSFDDPSDIEIEHPRHPLSRRNFERDGVQKNAVWSHDLIASEVLAAAEEEAARKQDRGGKGTGTTTASDPSEDEATTQETQETPRPAGTAGTPPIPTELSLLERLVRDPLSLYLKDCLGIDVWRDDDTAIPATLPLMLPAARARELTLELLGELIDDPAATARWLDAKHRSGTLPVASHFRRQVDEILALANGLLAGVEQNGRTRRGLAPSLIHDIALGRHRLVATRAELRGTLERVHHEPNDLLIVRPDEAGLTRYNRPLHMAALHLLAARANGTHVDRALVIARRDDWQLGKVKKPSPRFPEPRPVDAWQERVVRLEDRLMSPAAAAARLDEIAAIAHDAVKHPRPAFAETLTCAAAEREQEFEKAVGSEFYARSSECALFGVSPSFVDVFAHHPDRLAFLDTFARLLLPAYDKQRKAYFLA